jgi:hypothetical protein
VSLADYRAAWAALVLAWLEAGPDSPAATALLSRALDSGVAALDLAPVEPASVGVGKVRRCEVALVRLAGAVDEAGYLAHNPPQAERGADPVDHFCRRGWRALRNPSLDFDVWWYVAEHLDPTDESETALNPLVHWLLQGRFDGLLPLPPRPARPAYSLPTDRPVSRAVLFAAYDRDGLVDECVVDYVRELARHADVFVLYDGTLVDGQLDLLAPYVAGAWVREHGAYDFGSWSLLASSLVGWPVLEEYDEVVLVNDSCWLVRPLEDVFTTMSAQPSHFWGLQLTARRFEPSPLEPQSVTAAEVRRSWLHRSAYRMPELVHVGSYFLALRAPVVADPGFRRRLESVRPGLEHGLLVQRYEYGTTQYLLGQGYELATFVPGLLPNHPVYGPGAFSLVAQGFPLFKRRFLVANPYDTPGLADWEQRLRAAAPDAPVELFARNLARVGDPEALARSFAL